MAPPGSPHVRAPRGTARNPLPLSGQLGTCQPAPAPPTGASRTAPAGGQRHACTVLRRSTRVPRSRHAERICSIPRGWVRGGRTRGGRAVSGCHPLPLLHSASAASPATTRAGRSPLRPSPPRITRCLHRQGLALVDGHHGWRSPLHARVCTLGGLAAGLRALPGYLRRRHRHGTPSDEHNLRRQRPGHAPGPVRLFVPGGPTARWRQHALLPPGRLRGDHGRSPARRMVRPARSAPAAHASAAHRPGGPCPSGPSPQRPFAPAALRHGHHQFGPGPSSRRRPAFPWSARTRTPRW